MDLGTIIMGTILTALCVVPVVLLNRGKNKRKKQMLNRLENAAHKKNGSITEHEICGDFIIGIDKQSGYLLFIKSVGDDYKMQNINLAEIRSCKTTNSGRITGSGGAENKVIDRLCLTFVSKNVSEAPIELEFFNADKNSQLSGELQAIEKWQKIIDRQIRHEQ